MGTIVEWSIRDETMHVQGNAKLFREFCEEHPRIVNDELKSKIYEMAKQGVKLYDRLIADRRLLQLGLKPKFNAKDNPLPWLDWVLNGASHDNFFEKRVTEYSVVGMEGDWGWDRVA